MPQQQIADFGVIIEPSLRMSFKEAPWDYEIRVALPAAYFKSDKRYPVVWVTDGSFRFTRSVSTVNSASMVGEIPEMVVVSVGAPPEATEEVQARRTYDFTHESEKQCTYM